MESYVIIGLLVVLCGAVLYAARSLRRPADTKPDQSVLMLSQRVEALSHQLSHQMEQSRQATERSGASVFSQVQAFTQGMTELRESVKQVRESVKDVASFQEMFRSPKLRGQWGELSLGAILKEYFPKGGYEEQHYFAGGEAVDAVVRLPNGLLLPIDSKFNWDNFKKMTESESETARAAYRKQFLSDVKKKVDEIATKYVLPSEGTVDMALMYMPAESIYYEVVQNVREEDVAEYARKRKVYLTSPNTLYITLSAVIHWFKDSQLQSQTRAIMKRLETVIKDAGTLANEFRKLGDHLSDASSAYERTDKKLGHLVERTQKVIEMSEQENLLS
ncbi:MAG TPA: DNA recombination protein RmuC [Candidatus Paceibacterota bacterium]|nr:DNA recombination protein RmuC [Candidatus Paceibacterota bacterium]